MKAELFEVSYRSTSLWLAQATIGWCLLSLALFCVPAKANSSWSGELTNGETQQFIYTGEIDPNNLPIIIESINLGPWSLPSNPCNPVQQGGCSIALYEIQATLSTSNTDFSPEPESFEEYCDDADSCGQFIQFNHPDERANLLTSFFSVTASISGFCAIERGDPTISTPQPSCDGFSLPPYIDATIEVTGDGDLEATPLPAALPLFASGLGALALVGWRRISGSGKSR